MQKSEQSKVSYICKNCGDLMNMEDWEKYYGLCYKCFMLGSIDEYVYNNVDEILELKRSNNKVE